MKICPKCRRQATEEERFCRTCYTVFPYVDPAISIAHRKTRAKTVSGVFQLLILFTLSAGVWMYQLAFDFFPGMNFAAQSQITSITQSARRIFGSAMQLAEELQT